MRRQTTNIRLAGKPWMLTLALGWSVIASAAENAATPKASIAPGMPPTESSTSSSVVEPDVYEAFGPEEASRVDIVVALRQPSLSSADGPARQGELIAARERDVLDATDPEDFEVGYAYKTFAGLAGRATRRGLEALARHPTVIAIGLDQEGQTAGLGVDAHDFVGSTFVRSRLNVDGGGVTVAVIDTGVDGSHPDLAASIVEGAWHFLNRGDIQGPGAVDVMGHGTFVARIIASDGIVGAPGVAPGVGILPIQVFNGNLQTNLSDVVAALDHVVATRDQYLNLAVVNLSVGFGRYSHCPCDEADANARLAAAALSAARDAGISCFASSGNNGSCTELRLPACTSATVSVGVVYEAEGSARTNFGCSDNPEPDMVACFTNRGGCLDLVAPGGPALGSGFASYATSWSSPVAAAAAALIHDAATCGDETPTPEHVLSQLESTASLVPVRCNAGRQVPSIRIDEALLSILESCDAGDDCNDNGLPDAFEVDCDGNGVTDACDIARGTSPDVDGNSIPDGCEIDCNQNGFPDHYELAERLGLDCNENLVPDDCDIADGTSQDIDASAVPDECEQGFDVSTERLEFGEVVVGDVRVLEFTLRNTGTVSLHISEVSTWGSRSNYAVVPEIAGVDLPPLEELTVSVELRPSRTGSQNGRVDVRSDFVANPTLRVQLRGVGIPPWPAFRRGDANGDDTADLSDAVFVLSWLFLGAAEPGCHDAADVNADGEIDVSDPTALLNHLFLGGEAPENPYPDCGIPDVVEGTMPNCLQSACP